MPRKYDLEFKLEAIRMASEPGVTNAGGGKAAWNWPRGSFPLEARAQRRWRAGFSRQRPFKARG